MKFLYVTKSGKIKCKKNDGVEKAYKASKEVLEYVRKNFKENDVCYGKWDKSSGELVKLYKPQPKGTYKKGGNYYSNGGKGNLDLQSAVKSASEALKGIDGVDATNYEEIYKNLIKINIDTIVSKNSTSKSTTTHNADDDSPEQDVVDEQLEDVNIEDE